jgi:hypothetical protein
MNAVQKLLRRGPLRTAWSPAAPRRGAILGLMTAKERLLKEVARWSERDAEVALRAVERDHAAAADEPEMVGLPEAWKTFEDGTPVPNWVALLHETRAAR